MSARLVIAFVLPGTARFCQVSEAALATEHATASGTLTLCI